MNQLNNKGQRHGPWKEKARFGCTHTLNYMNSLRHGSFEAYDEHSILQCKGQYINGLKDGEWFENGISQVFTWIRNYSKGELISKKFYL